MLSELFKIDPRDSILLLHDLFLVNPGLQLFQAEEGEVCMLATHKLFHVVLDLVQFVLFSMFLLSAA